MDWTVTGSAFALLVLAEFGDKSQLMVMSLSARYRVLPVIVGVFAAFALLNLLAVTLGAALYLFLPRWLVYAVAAVVFLSFAWQSWRSSADEDNGTPVSRTARSALVASFVLILIAELGDKTQVAVAALAGGTAAPLSVFTGATAALWLVSLAAIVAGCTLLRRIPPVHVHRGAGALFAAFGVLAGFYCLREVL